MNSVLVESKVVSFRQSSTFRTLAHSQSEVEVEEEEVVVVAVVVVGSRELRKSLLVLSAHIDLVKLT